MTEQVSERQFPHIYNTVPDRSNLTGNALLERLGNAKGTLRER